MGYSWLANLQEWYFIEGNQRKDVFYCTGMLIMQDMSYSNCEGRVPGDVLLLSVIELSAVSSPTYRSTEECSWHPCHWLRWLDADEWSMKIFLMLHISRWLCWWTVKLIPSAIAYMMRFQMVFIFTFLIFQLSCPQLLRNV